MKKLMTILLLSLMTMTTHSQNYLLGDVNRDGDVTVADVTMLVDIITKGYTPFIVSPTAITIPAGGSAVAYISGGYYQYEVTSANTGVVTAALNGSVITLNAVASGETKVIVMDVLTNRSLEVPVKVEYTSLQLSSTRMFLVVGNESDIYITHGSGSGSYSVESSDESVATSTVRDDKVSVSAIGVGIATITVTDTENGHTATFKVTVNAAQSYNICPDNNHPHLIDLGLPSGTLWSCCNVDTDHPEGQSPTNYGGYYAWGETETKTTYNMESYIYCDGDDEFASFHDIGSDISDTDYDVAHMKWGGNWVMPTEAQCNELITNCTYEWTKVEGVKGGKFTSKINGSSIFLPTAGDRSEYLSGTGSRGYYLSSLPGPSGSDGAYNLYFGSDYAGWSYYYRFNGFTVRPVARN